MHHRRAAGAAKARRASSASSTCAKTTSGAPATRAAPSTSAAACIERDIIAKAPDKNEELILYCGGGFRSALAADNLLRMGYTRVRSLAGGWRDWNERGLPTEKIARPNAAIRLPTRSYDVMATFVLVHGAGTGGWLWRRVRSLLTRAGHEVFTRRRTGFSASARTWPDATQPRHPVEDVVGLIEYEELEDVVLVGFSYAGMIIPPSPDRLPGRVSASSTSTPSSSE